MLVFRVANGWGGNDSTHSYEIPNANEFEYFIVTFEARHYRAPLSWKLRDESGSEQHLPFFFKKGELSKINILVYGASGDYKFECDVKCWPKTLQMPIAKYYSITSVQLAYPVKCSETPFGEHRQKGQQKWAINSIVTFDRADEVRECRQYYRIKNPALKNDIIIEGPIIEAKCLWHNFDIEKESSVDLEEMITQRKFVISFSNNSLLHASYYMTMKMLEPIDHEDANKEVTIRKGSVQQEYSFVSGAQYEFKLHINGLNVSFPKTIQVPTMSIDQVLWTRFFGQASHVAFLNRESDTEFRYTDWYAGEGEEYEDNIKERYLTLYKHGSFHFKATLQRQGYKLETTLSYGGTFSLFKPSEGQKSVHFELMKLFRNKTEARPVRVSSTFDMNEELPTALQLPELVNAIIHYLDNAGRTNSRLVCRAWSQFVQPQAILGTLTENSVQIDGYAKEFARHY